MVCLFNKTTHIKYNVATQSYFSKNNNQFDVILPHIVLTFCYIIIKQADINLKLQKKKRVCCKEFFCNTVFSGVFLSFGGLFCFCFLTIKLCQQKVV